jgi:flagellar hook-associated protein 1 FlgK
MSITSAFGAARSGLAVVEKRAEITAGNLANADRAGYVRRTVLQGPQAMGGVMLEGIRREADTAVERLHRIELSRSGRQEAIASGLELYTTRLGEPGSEANLVVRLSDLQNAFTQLANAPEQIALQGAVLQAAEGLARTLNDTSLALGEARMLARSRIDVSVGTLNSRLARIAELNREIAVAGSGTDQRAALFDEAGTLLDDLASVADLRTVQDWQGRMTVYTSGGTALVEGANAKTLRYDDATGSLLTDTIDITPGRPGARGFAQGLLAGEIFLLQEAIPQMQLQLDEVARALIDGFEAVEGGSPGLFVENPVPPSGASQGLSGRIAVNDAVRPEAGGELWRLRDGISATVQGPASDASRVNDFVAVFETAHAFDPAAGFGTSARIGEFTANLIADQQQTRVTAQVRSESLAAAAGALEAVRSGISGVDRDEELQRLVEIEQSYAANSTVIRTLTEMLDTLLAAF